MAAVQRGLKDLRALGVVTTRAAYATGLWNVTPRWRANGELHAEENRHDAEIRKINDIDLATALVGLSYVTPREDSIGAYGHVEHGRSPSDAELNGIPPTGRSFRCRCCALFLFASGSDRECGS